MSNPASSPASTRYAYVVFLKIERSLFLSKSLLFLLSPYCCHYQIYNPLINNQHLLFGCECFQVIQYDPCVCLYKVMSSMILPTCLQTDKTPNITPRFADLLYMHDKYIPCTPMSGAPENPSFASYHHENESRRSSNITNRANDDQYVHLR